MEGSGAFSGDLDCQGQLHGRATCADAHDRSQSNKLEKGGGKRLGTQQGMGARTMLVSINFQKWVWEVCVHLRKRDEKAANEGNELDVRKYVVTSDLVFLG